MKKMIPSKLEGELWAGGFCVCRWLLCTCAEENSGHDDTTLKTSFAFCASLSFYS